MTGAAPVPLRLVTKEIRPLLLAFVTCIAAMVAGSLFGRDRYVFDDIGFVIPAYFVGAAALGALSVGHEYSHGTVGQLLSQPVSRQRLLLVKLGVLAAMLVMVSAVAWTVGVRDGRTPGMPFDPIAIGLLTILSGLFVGPWLTMACRSPIAGTVFALSAPGLPLIAIRLVYLAVHRQEPPLDFQMAVLWRGGLAICAVGAVMTARMFMRLEAIDGGGPDVHLPEWLRGRATSSIAAPALTKRHPIWLLVKKELRLQQMAFAVAGVSVLGWFALATRLRGDQIDDMLSVLTFSGAIGISMLIGSLASAEERQLGTLEWQLLLPIDIWKQWAVKVGATVGLALLLALAVPVLVAAMNPALHIPPVGVQLQLAAVITALTAGSLYVSSVSTDGLRAFLGSVAALVGAALFLRLLFEYPGSAVFALVSRLFTSVAPPVAAWQVNLGVMVRALLLLTAGFVLMVLRFALTNHRSADRAVARVWPQAIWMALYLMAGVTLVAGMAALS